jgi:ABC-type branched-subunit amino acid transport system permease subunit
LRHLGGLLIGLVVTAAVLGGGGWAVQQAFGSAAANPPDNQKMWIALGAMAAVGLVVGLVVAGRVSPLATFVPSMVLLAWTVIYALDVNRALSLIPAEPSVNQIIRDAGFGARTMLTTGVFALLGVAMFIPVLMPSRWSRRHDDLDEEYETTPEGSYY